MSEETRKWALALLARLAPERARSYGSWRNVGDLLQAAGCSVEDWINWLPDGDPRQPVTCRDCWPRSTPTHREARLALTILQLWGDEDSRLEAHVGSDASVGPHVADQAHGKLHGAVTVHPEGVVLRVSVSVAVPDDHGAAKVAVADEATVLRVSVFPQPRTSRGFDIRIERHAAPPGCGECGKPATA